MIVLVLIVVIGFHGSGHGVERLLVVPVIIVVLMSAIDDTPLSFRVLVLIVALHGGEGALVSMLGATICVGEGRRWELTFVVRLAKLVARLILVGF